MSETWQVYSLEELDTITFECPRCKTSVTFSVKEEIVTRSRAERMCAGCNNEIPDAGTLLNLYRTLYVNGKSKVLLRAKI